VRRRSVEDPPAASPGTATPSQTTLVDGNYAVDVRGAEELRVHVTKK
jgi:hypothetical protein